MNKFENEIASLISTSVDDCRISMEHCRIMDIPMLEKLLKRCESINQKSRAAVVRRRLKQLKKESGNAKA